MALLACSGHCSNYVEHEAGIVISSSLVGHHHQQLPGMARKSNMQVADWLQPPRRRPPLTTSLNHEPSEAVSLARHGRSLVAVHPHCSRCTSKLSRARLRDRTGVRQIPRRISRRQSRPRHLVNQANCVCSSQRVTTESSEDDEKWSETSALCLISP